MDKLNLELFKLNRQRLIEAFSANKDHPVLFLKGANDMPRFHSDMDQWFHQEMNFFWVTGVEHEADCYAMIDTRSGEYTLFVPQRGEAYAVWVGKLMTLDDYQVMYQADRTISAAELAANIPKDRIIYTTQYALPELKEMNLDNQICAEDSHLFDVIAELRLHKTSFEIDMIKKSCAVLDEALQETLPKIKEGLPEYAVRAEIMYQFARRGALFESFNPIPAAHKNASILHYLELSGKAQENKLFLLDCGCEYHCYASDVTRTVPVGGKFTPKQAELYQIVLDASTKAIEMMAPGVEWFDVHTLSQRIVGEGLIKAGIITLPENKTVEDALEEGVVSAFFPTGLGHSMGLEVHDMMLSKVLFPKGRCTQPWAKPLRMNRPLETGMVMTVEPGIYFPEVLMNKFAKSHPEWINFEKVAEYHEEVGGIRLEQDILITENGYENLTKCPIQIADVEKMMSQ